MESWGCVDPGFKTPQTDFAEGMTLYRLGVVFTGVCCTGSEKYFAFSGKVQAKCQKKEQVPTL